VNESAEHGALAELESIGDPRTDAQKHARVDWRIGDAERRTLVRIAELARDAFLCAGLPEPILEPWVAEQRPQDSIIIDMAHTAGTTRMSENPRSGVVDSNCRIHGVDGLYVAGPPDFSD